MKELWLHLLSFLGLAYWVEISTNTPHCTYYFGPFSHRGDAETAQSGYIEDLKGEGAQGIRVQIKQCKPTDLTIFDEGDERSHPFRPMISVGS